MLLLVCLSVENKRYYYYYYYYLSSTLYTSVFAVSIICSSSLTICSARIAIISALLWNGWVQKRPISACESSVDWWALASGPTSGQIGQDFLLGEPQSTYLSKRWNRVSVSAHSAGAYTATLLVMVNVIKGGGRAPPTLTSPGKFCPHDWMYARKQTLLLCVLCGGGNSWGEVIV